MLTRWKTRDNRSRHVVCIGDSITHGSAGRAPLSSGVSSSWVDQFSSALDDATGPRPGDGFRGMWRKDEWHRSGEWTRTLPSDRFDVVPFGEGYYSSGRTTDTMTWTKPASMHVSAFELVWFHMPGTGSWQYRIDGGDWTSAGQPRNADFRLHRLFVAEGVTNRIEIRGHDGTAPCVAPIAGIDTFAAPPGATTGTTVHNLGQNQQLLARFCRASEGDPLALLDELRPAVATVLFSNDTLLDDDARFGDELRALVTRLSAYAEVLIISPYEQQPPPGNENRRSVGMQAKYRAVARRVAATSGCEFIDLYEAWAELVGPGFAAAQSAGLMLDRLHPSQLGHDDIATRVNRALGLGSGEAATTISR